MIIRVYIRTNVACSTCEDEIEVPDDATEDEIFEEAKEAAFNMSEWGYEKKQ